MSQAEIVTVPTKVIPENELTKVETAIGNLATEAVKLAALKTEAEGLLTAGPSGLKSIESKENYRRAGEIVALVRKDKKIGGFNIDPLLDIVNRVGDFLRLQRATHEEKCKEIQDLLTKPIVDYDAREAAARLAEQQRIIAARNLKAQQDADERKREAELIAAETRKQRVAEIKAMLKEGKIGQREASKLLKEAGAVEEAAIEAAAADAEEAKARPAPEVKVHDDIPHVKGLYKTRRWYWKMVDISKVPREMLYPSKSKDGTYDVAKFPAISELVGKEMDKAKAEVAIPGIEVWYEDKV